MIGCEARSCPSSKIASTIIKLNSEAASKALILYCRDSDSGISNRNRIEYRIVHASRRYMRESRGARLAGPNDDVDDGRHSGYGHRRDAQECRGHTFVR